MNFGKFLTQLNEQNARDNKIKELEKTFVKNDLKLPTESNSTMQGTQIDIFSYADDVLKQKIETKQNNIAAESSKVTKIENNFKHAIENRGLTTDNFDEIRSNIEIYKKLISLNEKVKVNTPFSLEELTYILENLYGISGVSTPEEIYEHIQKDENLKKSISATAVGVVGKRKSYTFVGTHNLAVILDELKEDTEKDENLVAEFSSVLEDKSKKIQKTKEIIKSLKDSQESFKNKDAVDFFKKELERLKSLNLPEAANPDNLLFEIYKVEQKIKALETDTALQDFEKMSEEEKQKAIKDIKDTLAKGYVKEKVEIVQKQEKNNALAGIVASLVESAAVRQVDQSKDNEVEKESTYENLDSSFNRLDSAFPGLFIEDLKNLTNQTKSLGIDFSQKEGFFNFVETYKDFQFMGDGDNGYKIAANPEINYTNPGFSINGGDPVYNHPHAPSTSILVLKNNGEEVYKSVVELCREIRNKERLENISEVIGEEGGENPDRVDLGIEDIPDEKEAYLNELGKDAVTGFEEYKAGVGIEQTWNDPVEEDEFSAEVRKAMEDDNEQERKKKEEERLQQEKDRLDRERQEAERQRKQLLAEKELLLAPNISVVLNAFDIDHYDNLNQLLSGLEIKISTGFLRSQTKTVESISIDKTDKEFLVMFSDGSSASIDPELTSILKKSLEKQQNKKSSIFSRLFS